MTEGSMADVGDITSGSIEGWWERKMNYTRIKFQGIIRFNSQLFWSQTTWGPHILVSS